MRNPLSLLSLVGVSYRSAPMALRERLAFPEAAIPPALKALHGVAREGLILSTCNRTEIYLVRDREPTSEDILAQLRGMPPGDLRGHCYTLAEEAAVRHLFRVASGLDSMVLGETQILGQVKDAFDAALRAGSVGRVLGRVLALALEVGKRARSETGISRRALSPSSVAVELARQALGDLRPLTALVVGAGDAGRTTARSLHAAGVERILVANRSPERGAELAQALGATAVPYPKLRESLTATDIVVTSTGASDHVITAELVRQILPARGGRPLLCIDIAVPRDIDPSVGTLPSVALYNIDHLEALCDAHLQDRAAEISDVEGIVEEGLDDYRDWRAVEHLVPTIGAVYQQAEALRRTELERTMRRLKRLSEEERELIDVMTAAIVRRLLHGPVAALKARSRDPEARELAKLAQQLFALPPEEREEVQE